MRNWTRIPAGNTISCCHMCNPPSRLMTDSQTSWLEPLWLSAIRPMLACPMSCTAMPMARLRSSTYMAMIVATTTAMATLSRRQFKHGVIRITPSSIIEAMDVRSHITVTMATTATASHFGRRMSAMARAKAGTAQHRSASLVIRADMYKNAATAKIIIMPHIPAYAAPCRDGMSLAARLPVKMPPSNMAVPFTAIGAMTDRPNSLMHAHTTEMCPRNMSSTGSTS